MARLDALPNQIATAFVFVIGIIAGITAVIKSGIETIAKSATAKAAATETAAAEAMTTAAATMTATAAATTGQGCRAGCTQQDRRRTDRAEGIAAEQNHRGQPAAHCIAARFSGLIFIRGDIFRYSHSTLRSHGLRALTSNAQPTVMVETVNLATWRVKSPRRHCRDACHHINAACVKRS